MKKIKIVEGATAELLEYKTNEALSTIKAESVELKYMLPENMIVIEYEEICRKCKCMDCQFYDKSGDTRGAWGLCQRKGIRERFNSDACEWFEDLRG